MTTRSALPASAPATAATVRLTHGLEKVAATAPAVNSKKSRRDGRSVILYFLRVAGGGRSTRCMRGLGLTDSEVLGRVSRPKFMVIKKVDSEVLHRSHCAASSPVSSRGRTRTR